jgi:hypothetical protein
VRAGLGERALDDGAPIGSVDQLQRAGVGPPVVPTFTQQATTKRVKSALPTIIGIRSPASRGQRPIGGGGGHGHLLETTQQPRHVRGHDRRVRQTSDSQPASWPPDSLSACKTRQQAVRPSATVRGDAVGICLPPQAARTVGPPRTRPRRRINRAKRTARPGRSTPPKGGIGRHVVNFASPPALGAARRMPV